MFDNIGKKIQFVAFVQFVVGVIISVMCSIFYTVTSVGNIVVALAIVLLGGFISWALCLGLMGFGIIVEKVEYLSDCVTEKIEHISDNLAEIEAVLISHDEYVYEPEVSD